MNLIVYRGNEFPTHELIFPDCRESKKYCHSNNKITIKIEDLKELQRQGYKFKYKLKDWKNLQEFPVKGE